MTFVINLWDHKSPHSWYFRLWGRSISFGAHGGTVRVRLSNTHNTPDVVNEMISIDRVQPHSDPIRRRKLFGCLTSHTVSIRGGYLSSTRTDREEVQQPIPGSILVGSCGRYAVLEVVYNHVRPRLQGFSKHLVRRCGDYRSSAQMNSVWGGEKKDKYHRDRTSSTTLSRSYPDISWHHCCEVSGQVRCSQGLH